MVDPVGRNRSVVPLRSPTTAAEATKVATDFYAAFSRRDGKAMRAAYDPAVRFNDPLFGNLKGIKQVMGMWDTITPAANPKTFKIETKVQPNPKQNADGSFSVKVHWDAHYDIGKRHIENHSDTTLTIKNGKIIEQRDAWDLDAWTKQALPLGGGTKVGDAVAHFLAHGFIEFKAGWKP
jgi:limonene-1,2-epoxide hydrolase